MKILSESPSPNHDKKENTIKSLLLISDLENETASKLKRTSVVLDTRQTELFSYASKDKPQTMIGQIGISINSSGRQRLCED